MLDLVIAGPPSSTAPVRPPSLARWGSGRRRTWIGRGAERHPRHGGRGAIAAGTRARPRVHRRAHPLRPRPAGRSVDASTLRQGVTIGRRGQLRHVAVAARRSRSGRARVVGRRRPRRDVRFDSFGGYLDALDAARPAVNVAALVGHGSPTSRRWAWSGARRRGGARRDAAVDGGGDGRGRRSGCRPA